MAVVAVHGGDIEPGLKAVGLALLALTVAVLAAHGAVRRLAGVLVIAVGITGAALAIASLSATGSVLVHDAFDPSVRTVSQRPNAWWVVTLVAALLSTWAGIEAVLRGGQWRSLGTKYEVPQAVEAGEGVPETTDDLATWQALDRGEDPTL